MVKTLRQENTCLLLQIRTEAVKQRDHKSDQRVSSTGVSVLSIVGGNRPNMVPDRCTARMKGSMDLGKAAGDWAAATGEQIAVSRDGEEYVVEITGIPEDATVQLLDYPGDRVDFYEGATVGVLSQEYRYGDGADEVIPAGTLVILGTYRGDPTYNTVEIEAVYNTTGEAAEANGVTTITRPMNGYGLLFAEIPADGAVSDTSDGFFLFVPDLESEEDLNAQSGVTDPYPLEIRANFYRTDDPNSADSRRLTSQTLWISFPAEDTLPAIELTGSAN